MYDSLRDWIVSHVVQLFVEAKLKILVRRLYEIRKDSKVDKRGGIPSLSNDELFIRFYTICFSLINDSYGDLFLGSVRK